MRSIREKRLILCVETGQLFSSQKECYEEMGINKSTLNACLIRGVPNKKKSLSFKYVTRYARSVDETLPVLPIGKQSLLEGKDHGR